MTMTPLAELADAKWPPAGIYEAVSSPSAEQRSVPTWGCATEPLRLSWSRVFFLGKQVEELIGGQDIDLYSADSCGRGAHLEPNREFVLECARTPPPGWVARGRLYGDDGCRGRGRWPRAGRFGGAPSRSL